MNPQIKIIADRIKELREILEISRQTLSHKVGITPEEYIAYENGEKDIPIGVLYAVAAELNVDPTVLMTGDVPRMDEYTIVRKGHGISVERFKGYSFAALAFNYKNRDMEPMIVTLNKQQGLSEFVTHAGQEFNYVLEGTVMVCIGKHKFELNEGDSVYFNPAIPHGQYTLCDTARFLTVINE